MANDGRFELYQAVQRANQFKGVDWIVSFAATPLNETLFVGLFRVRGQSNVPINTTCPVTGDDLSGFNMLSLECDPALAEYAGRVLIDWGEAYRSWIQRAHLHDKAIIEIRQTAVDPPFPGFQSFSWPIRELSSVPRAWRDVLRASRGVYLLVCRSSGRLYVGSAYGPEGFWSRFQEYYRTGHGYNEGMKAIDTHDFQASILECAASSAAIDEIIRSEEVWKSKLLSRRFGLNLN